MSIKWFYCNSAPNGLRYAPSGYWWVGRGDAILPELTSSQESVVIGVLYYHNRVTILFLKR